MQYKRILVTKIFVLIVRMYVLQVSCQTALQFVTSIPVHPSIHPLPPMVSRRRRQGKHVDLETESVALTLSQNWWFCIIWGKDSFE